MKNLVPIFFVFISGLGTVAAQEVDLDPDRSVNVQIFADTLGGDGSFPTVYNAKAGEVYFFDGPIEINFDLTIKGPDKGWILKDATPSVFYQTPAEDGSARDMINLNEGGSVTLRNIMLTGLHPNDVNISFFVRNFAGYRIIFDNCVFTDYKDCATRTTGPTQEISITNCIFINGVRRSSSPWGGIPLRLDDACEQLTFENNTVVNSGRLLGNGGNYFTSKLSEIHNTILNQPVSTHELHWFEGLQANNIFYNWSWRGVIWSSYEKYFTTFETFAGVKEKLDSIALYQGRNLFYLDPAFPEYWQNIINPMADERDSVFASYLWNIDVDSTIKADDNFTIGKSYGNWDPLFTNDPSQIDSMLGWCLATWIPEETHFPDWRVTLPVTYNGDSLPVLNWPPDFDLSYSRPYLLTAGTDGLPLGDLNWFPDAKALYLANRDVYIAALQDSMANATDVYVPGDRTSALITPGIVSVEDFAGEPVEFSLSQNYPNPFNPNTSICFSLPRASDVLLEVYNNLGQKIKTLLSGRKTAGRHTLKFDASHLASGVYYYRIHAGDYVRVKKMLLMK